MAGLKQLAESRPGRSVGSDRAPAKLSLKRKLENAFKAYFLEGALVDVSDGYADGIHIVVVSRSFDRMSERSRQNLMGRILGQAGLTEKDQNRVTLLYAISPGELK